MHGTGTPEPANVLAENSFTAPELEQLASLYPTGKTLWRCSVPHFASADDLNFANNPANAKKTKSGQKPVPPKHDRPKNGYGTLNFSDRTFMEQIPLVGVPFDLNYNSARVPDYRVLSELLVPVSYFATTRVTATTCPQAFHAKYRSRRRPRTFGWICRFSARIATRSCPKPTRGPRWNGMAGIRYGRLVGGSGPGIVTVAYEWTDWNYGGIFGGPELSRAFPQLFGNDGNEIAFEGHAGTTLAVGETFQQIFTIPDHRALGFGGWSPTVLHRLDPIAGILCYGDGRIRTVPLPPIQGAFLNQIHSLQTVVAAAPDGSLYFDGTLIGRGDGSFIFRRLPDGTFQIVTAPVDVQGGVHPNGSDWTQVDGQSVTNVSVAGVDFEDMCVGPDGSLYVTDGFGHRPSDTRRLLARDFGTNRSLYSDIAARRHTGARLRHDIGRTCGDGSRPRQQRLFHHHVGRH